ncbi:MAG: hypothetical protein FRX49_03775 [Trebouxia sp. A1-2]|nr:MAG: hypothetical protein FRX49_03775 [Trebouxia sp. A1-2]
MKGNMRVAQKWIGITPGSGREGVVVSDGTSFDSQRCWFRAEYNMPRIAAKHVSLKGLSVLRKATLDVQDEQMQDPPAQRNKAETPSTTTYINRENADLRESLQWSKDVAEAPAQQTSPDMSTVHCKSNFGHITQLRMDLPSASLSIFFVAIRACALTSLVLKVISSSRSS